MISIITIRNEIKKLYNRDSAYIEVKKFNPGGKGFLSPSSEEQVWFLKGNKKEFGNLSHFWLQSIEITQAGDSENKLPQCKQITGVEGYSILESHNYNILKHVQLNLEEDFQTVFIMFMEWDNKIIISEGFKNYIYFEWSTTA